MATMNFSIPDDVKEAFNEAFKDENKSAVVAGLMKRAIQDRKALGTEEERKARFDAAIKRLDEMRRSGETYTDEEIKRAREEGRP
jgi:hypothetical protein